LHLLVESTNRSFGYLIIFLLFKFIIFVSLS